MPSIRIKHYGFFHGYYPTPVAASRNLVPGHLLRLPDPGASGKGTWRVLLGTLVSVLRVGGIVLDS